MGEVGWHRQYKMCSMQVPKRMKRRFHGGEIVESDIGLVHSPPLSFPTREREEK